MSETFEKSRRETLKAALGLTGLALVTNPPAKAFGQGCQTPTPAQTEGPFYPIDTTVESDADLTFLKDRSQRAKGQVIYVKGRVLNARCEPIAKANVEIWQACQTGRYNHPADSENPAPLDPNFQYWGRVLTDANGEYLFKTIIPGSYPAGPGWMRPAHIHFKAQKLGFLELTTQMYFDGDRYNATDRILQNLARHDQEKVIVTFTPSPEGHEPGSLLGTFDLVLAEA